MSKITPDNFGKNMKALRLLSGMTQRELCDKAHASYSTLIKIERGAIKSPSVLIVSKLTDAMGYSLSSALMDATGNTRK